MDAMQQLVLIVCAQTSAEANFINCQSGVPWYDIFFLLDRDEDGLLSFHEFVQGLKLLLGSSNMLSDEQLELVVRALDLDCSGAIEWVEWAAVALLAERSMLEEAEPLTTAFRLLDRPSGDGTVGAADLLAVINSDSKSMFITSSQGREQVIRILTRWVPSEQMPKRQGTNSVVSPPSMKLVDMKKVLEACLVDEKNYPMPVIVQSKSLTAGWFRSAPWGCPASDTSDRSWCPDTKSEMQVIVNQKRAVPTHKHPAHKKDQAASSDGGALVGSPASSDASRMSSPAHSAAERSMPLPSLVASPSGPPHNV
jgi:Ca2+-binding EF-hand superfamily protein